MIILTMNGYRCISLYRIDSFYQIVQNDVLKWFHITVNKYLLISIYKRKDLRSSEVLGKISLNIISLQIDNLFITVG